MIASRIPPVTKLNLLKVLWLKMPALGWVFCLSVLLTACGQRHAELRLEGMQGTALWHVTLTNPPATLAEADLQTGLSKTFADTNQLISTWDDSSEISGFNRYQGTDWFSVSPKLAKLVELTLHISQQSAGMYDVTVRPLIQLWGFSSHETSKGTVPSQADIDAARAKVGYQKLQVRFDPPALRKSQADLRVELASVADGFAADQAGLYLEALGIHDYMVEIAGEVRTRGLSPRGDAWHIAIEKPVEEGHVVQQGVSLRDAGLATSGDYRSFFMQGGKRYSHTFDPTTGAPVTHNLASVSVLASEATLADAYATLFMVLGEEKSKAFADTHAINAYFIWRTDQGFKTADTVGFRNSLIEQ
jgi:FAD:protein FMN transferase